MPRISQMFESRFLRQSDIAGELSVTIAKIEKVNIARDDEPAEYKWAARFEELAKPLVLNVTNIQLLAKACGSDDSDAWTGRKVMLYVDHSISFQGKVVGGLRVRAPQAR